jgi:serine/threonine-protein kinase
VGEATDRLEGIGLRVETEERFSDTIEDDHVISQSHAEGESLKAGYTITLTVSKGPQLIKVPTIRQKTIAEAEIILENAGLMLGEATYTFSELPEGYIVEQSPEAGTDMNEGGRVSVVVSEGPESSLVLMPGLVGKTVEEAEGVLEPLNLLIGEITYESSGEHGIDEIIRQSVEAGTEIEEGERVDLVVSSDEKTDGVEETPPEEESPGGITRTYVIPLNFEGESAVVRVEKIEASGISEIVYENRHLKTEENIRVQVTAEGRVTINFYYDDRLVSTKVETFE